MFISENVFLWKPSLTQDKVTVFCLLFPKKKRFYLSNGKVVFYLPAKNKCFVLFYVEVCRNNVFFSVSSLRPNSLNRIYKMNLRFGFEIWAFLSFYLIYFFRMLLKLLNMSACETCIFMILVKHSLKLYNTLYNLCKCWN